MGLVMHTYYYVLPAVVCLRRIQIYIFQVMESKRGKKCFAAHVRGSYFEKSKEVEKLIESTEVSRNWT